MKGLVIPVAMAVVGLALGAGAGLALRPGASPEAPAAAKPAEDHAEAGDDQAEGKDGHGAAEDDAHGGGHGDGHGASKPSAKGGKGGKGSSDPRYVLIEHQFVVPVIEDGRTRALVAMSIALDVEPAIRGDVIAAKPRLRDALLRALFDHSNTGGFAGAFTREDRFAKLRAALLEQARGVIGPDVHEVLITNVSRQEA